MGKHSDLAKLREDVEELRALKERLIKEYGPGPAKEAVYGIDQETKKTIRKIAQIEMQKLQSNTISAHY